MVEVNTSQINRNAQTAIEREGWQNELAVIVKNGWRLNLSGGIFKLTVAEGQVHEGDSLPTLVAKAVGGEAPAPKSKRVLDASDAPAPKEIEDDVDNIELDNTGKRERKTREVKAPRAPMANRYERTATIILGNLSIEAGDLATQAGLQYPAGVYCIEAFRGVTTALLKAGIISADQADKVTHVKAGKKGSAPPVVAPPATDSAATEAQPEATSDTPEATTSEAVSEQPEAVATEAQPEATPEATPEAEATPEVAPAKLSKNERRKLARAARAAANAASNDTTEVEQPEAVAKPSDTQE